MSFPGSKFTSVWVLGLLALAGVASASAAGPAQSPPETTVARPPSAGTQELATQQRPQIKLTPPGVPARFAQKVLRFPVSHCMSAAEHVVEKEVKLFAVRRGQDWIGGNNGLAHGYIYCVRLPGSGACDGDASSAIVITSGGNGKAVEDLFQALYKAIPVKQPIDCP